MAALTGLMAFGKVSSRARLPDVARLAAAADAIMRALTQERAAMFQADARGFLRGSPPRAPGFCLALDAAPAAFAAAVLAVQYSAAFANAILRRRRENVRHAVTFNRYSAADASLSAMKCNSLAAVSAAIRLVFFFIWRAPQHA